MAPSLRPGAANSSAMLALGALVLLLAGVGIGALLMRAPLPSSDDSASSSSVSSSVASSVPVATTGGATASTGTADQAAFDACINAANEAHNQRWADACQDIRVALERGHASCMAEKNDQALCDARWGGSEKIGDNCDLPTRQQNELNVQFEVAKAQCRRQYQ